MEKLRKSVLIDSGMTWQPQPDRIHHLTRFTFPEPSPSPEERLEHQEDENHETARVIFEIMVNSSQEEIEELVTKHRTQEK